MGSSKYCFFPIDSHNSCKDRWTLLALIFSQVLIFHRKTADYPFPMYPGMNFTLFALEAMVNFTVAAGFTLMLDIK